MDAKRKLAGRLGAEADCDGNVESEDDVTDSGKTSNNLKLKDLPLVHQARKRKDSQEEHLQIQDTWVLGGQLGSRNCILKFHCNALSGDPEELPANELHMTYKTIQAETKLLNAMLSSHGFREVQANIPDFNLLWTGIHPKPHMLKGLTTYQRVNHFPRSYELTRKDRLYKNIEKMQHIKGFKHFDFIPQTFVMPMDFRELCSTHNRNRGPWIVKPVASSRGRGIYIVNSPDQIAVEDALVVAKYIDNPLLIDGHKCDLRLYVAVTSYDPLIIYMYEEGLVRFATVKYDSSGKHLWNPCMHLCNYSINKYHSDYIKSDDPEAENVGHKWTLSALLRHLKSDGLNTCTLMQRVEELVVKAILASAPQIVAATRMFVPHFRNCFELYGFDILIDANLKPWLLEVNLSPSLGCDSPLDVRIKSALLADLLTLVGIPAVDPMVRRVAETRRYSSVEVFRKLGCRRVQSADTLPGTKKPKHGTPPRLASSTLTLSAEETKIVKYAKSEYERRGGFIRIFPSAESWKRYSCLLDPVTGVTCTGTSSSINPLFITIIPHNYNLMLHQQLFPGLQTIEKLPSNIHNVNHHSRYERALKEGHRASLDSKILQPGEDSGEDADETDNAKREIIICLEQGHQLSQFQARRIFGLYLSCLLKRLSNKEDAVTDEECHMILKYLQKASSNLRSPFFIQAPSRKLPRKDRMALVAKQLYDYIYLYNRETELYCDTCDKPNYLPNKLFAQFISSTSETDFEDVLRTQTRIYKCAHIYWGRCGPTPGSLSSSLAILRSFPPLGSTNAKVSNLPVINSCECVNSYRKTLPRIDKVGLKCRDEAPANATNSYVSTSLPHSLGHHGKHSKSAV